VTTTCLAGLIPKFTLLKLEQAKTLAKKNLPKFWQILCEVGYFLDFNQMDAKIYSCQNFGSQILEPNQSGSLTLTRRCPI
jgi:hypothetical protein